MPAPPRRNDKGTTLSTKVLAELNDALLGRQIDRGFALLRRLQPGVAQLQPNDPLATSALLSLAQWVDTGYEDHGPFDALLSRFAAVDPATMPFADYMRLRMAEGFRAFASEAMPAAIASFNFVLQAHPGILDPHLITVTHFWKARAHRTQGEYELALAHIQHAREGARELQAPKFEAVIKIHEGWLLFQRGQRRDAMRMMDEAETELRPTKHSLSLGNIESARGRFVRRSGEYVKALQHFENAVQLYSQRFASHPNLARALVNQAYVKRLIALDLRERSNAGRARAPYHQRFLETCQEALELLHHAGEIYEEHHHLTGRGTVLVNSGYLHMDCGDIDRAEEEAGKAFRLGEQRQDFILMARARTLQSILHHERAEEQIGDAADTATHAEAAKMHAESAIELAGHTQNKRLLAGAYLARSTAASSSSLQDWETARQFTALAGELLGKDDRDHLSKELIQLKARILQNVGVHDALRAWSEGIVGDKTFQQITEEFAEIVIPKVWLREDRKVARVAKKLSVSPKKVRRILYQVNLLKRD